ncbi:MAG: outer membrane beta-barrel protein [Beijerinckiaceae bacterium]
MKKAITGVKTKASNSFGALLLAGTMLVASQAHAQSLRGTVDEDPIARIGRTASERERNQPLVTPTGTRADSARPLRQRTVRRRTATQRNAPAAADDQRGTAPLLLDARRPPQQNFRTLERPVNTAVVNPNGEQLVNQGLLPPLTPRRVRASVVDPYAPLGLRTGSFLVLPTIDQQFGYDSNPERAASGQRKKGSAFSRTEAGFTARSDWSSNEAVAEFKAGYSKYFSAPNADRPDVQARLGYRHDVSKDTALDFELRGRLDTQTPGSTNLTGAATGRPLTYQTGASTGITQRFNRLAVSARASVDRSDFADAKLGNGQTLSQKDRNFTQYGLRLRTGYEVTPGIIPFAEVLVDTRQYDTRTDSSGFERNSNGMQLRAGTSFELTRTLTGEVLAGYGLRRFEDQRLRELRGPVVEGSLAWAVSPLTTVRLRGTTEFEETTQAGSSGSVTRRLSAELSHAFLRNLVFNTGASFARADFNGITRRDDTLRANFGFDYSVNRNLVLRANYAHERSTSNVVGNNISSNIWLFGARLQY